MDEKKKRALAYDKGGKRCGYMTSDMAEIFNSIMRGVRSLGGHDPVDIVCNHLSPNFYVSPFMATYNTLEALVRTWSPHFVPFWMKSNGSPTMVLDTWLTKL
jgi:hypothetical protein